MHKSTLSTNDFGNIYFGQKNQKQNSLRISRRLKWCLLEKFPTDRAKTRKCVFGQFFHSFENFVTIKKQLWNFNSSIDVSDVSETTDFSCCWKSCQRLFLNLS